MVVDAAELRARTAWGLIARPADPIAHQLQATLGPVDSLGYVLGRGTLSQVARVLERVTGGEHIPRDALGLYRSRYRPERVATAIAAQHRAGIVAISPAHPWWPKALSDLQSHAPSTLWMLGGLHQSALSQSVAIVGTLRPTPAGRSHTAFLVDAALGSGLSVISGGSRGIATEAHRRTVSAGGISLAVVAGGLENLYPDDNLALFQTLCARGAVLSEAPCTVAPTVERFLWRNRIVAALADATVVVQAEYRCGAISVAYQAAALGRCVGVVPGVWGDTRSRGCWRIYRECGAMVLTDPSDISVVVPRPTPRTLTEEARVTHDRV